MKPGGIVGAIDLATAFGWASGAPDAPPPVTGHGVFRVSEATDPAVGYAAFKWANDHFQVPGLKPTVLFIEQPRLIQNRGPNRRPENPKTLLRLWGLGAIIGMTAYGRGVSDIRVATADDVRRHFIGMKKALPGDVAKKLVQERCAELGWPYTTADEADALALWAYGCEQVQKGTGHAFAERLLQVRTPVPQERISAKEAAEKYFSKRRP